jgi:geranylgeranyl pyrophosphate synthase
MRQVTYVQSALKEKITEVQKEIDLWIDQLLPSASIRPEQLHTAMRYAMTAGGKRIRPVLLVAASKMGTSGINPLPAAVAIECLHTYTLIHDDLPCVDNSDLRRGRPSCHKEFDEATALLAGDALLTFAFELIAQEYGSVPEIAIALIKDLANASGSARLIGGQMEDIAYAGQAMDAPTLEFIHTNKTAALLTAALTMGLRIAGADSTAIATMGKIGLHLGMTFQIVDDILDATATTETMGKPVGLDAEAEKTTYPALYGLDGARERASKHTKTALSHLETIPGDTHFLREFIQELEHRAQ